MAMLGAFNKAKTTAEKLSLSVGQNEQSLTFYVQGDEFCASCVTTIKAILRPLGIESDKVNADISAREFTVIAPETLTKDEIKHALAEVGMDVKQDIHATPTTPRKV